MAEVVAEPDRLDEVLVEAQRTGDGARDLGDLERVRQPGSVVVALGRHEHLRLVLEAAERLGVDDPVAVALEGRAQRAVLLDARPPSGVGAGGALVELRLLERLHPGGEALGDGGVIGRERHASIVAASTDRLTRYCARIAAWAAATRATGTRYGEQET